MNRNETADLLAVAAAYDKRTVGEHDVTAWHLALREYTAEEATQAVVAHAKESSEYLKVFHIADRIRKARNDFVERQSVDRGFRDNRDAARDDRLAELLGGERRILEAAGEGNGKPSDVATGTKTLRPTPKGSTAKDAAQISTLAETQSIDLKAATFQGQPTIEYVMQQTGWEKFRALKALGRVNSPQESDCGCVPSMCPHVNRRDPIRIDRTRRTPTTTAGVGEREQAAEQTAFAHLDARGFNVKDAFGQGAA